MPSFVKQEVGGEYCGEEWTEDVGEGYGEEDEFVESGEYLGEEGEEDDISVGGEACGLEDDEETFAALVHLSKQAAYLLRHGMAVEKYENFRNGWFRFRDLYENHRLNKYPESLVRRIIQESRNPNEDSNRFEASFFLDGDSVGGTCCYVRSVLKRGVWDSLGLEPQLSEKHFCEFDDWLGQSISLSYEKGKGKGKACYTCNEQGHFARECPMLVGTTKRTICRFWKDAKCRRGTLCSYAHGQKEIGEQVMSAIEGMINVLMVGLSYSFSILFCSF